MSMTELTYEQRTANAQKVICDSFDTMEDFILYWQYHIESVKDDTRLLHLLIEDVKSLEIVTG